VAWPVIQVTEGCFILNMLGAKLLQQSIDNIGGLCDKMEIQKRKTGLLHFEISKAFKGYNERGIQ